MQVNLSGLTSMHQLVNPAVLHQKLTIIWISHLFVQKHCIRDTGKLFTFVLLGLVN